MVNIGSVWSRVTKYVFGLSNGWPQGDQAGSVMAMAAYGEGNQYHHDFCQALTNNLQEATFRPDEKAEGHPYWLKLREQARYSEQEQFALAAALQWATEDLFRARLARYLDNDPYRHLCLAGGVALNSVMMGKIRQWFPQLESVYICPVPYDGGLCIGAAQFIWHHVLGNPKLAQAESLSPYLGRTYSESAILEAIQASGLPSKQVRDSWAIDRLAKGCLVAVFREGAESGRRALGNRSILADPRRPEIKSVINRRVKHRQWYRPFAPVVLWQDAAMWFDVCDPCPYMSITVRSLQKTKRAAPAITHVDGSARIQTVDNRQNPWLAGLLELWKAKTGIPILLNTSFNDREPICESPEDALNCFMSA